MARKPGIRQVPEKDEQEDGRVRITRGGKKGKSKAQLDTVRMRGTEGSKTEKGGKNGKKSLEWI